MSGSGPLWLQALAGPLGGDPPVFLVPLQDPRYRPDLRLSENVPVTWVELTSENLADVEKLEDRPGTVVLAPPAVPARAPDVRYQPDGGPPLQGEAAVLARLLEGPLQRKKTLLFVTRSLLVSPETSRFRDWLDRTYAVDWVLYLGRSASLALGVPGLEMGALGLGPQAPDEAEVRDGEARDPAGVRLTRLVDLRDREPGEWWERLDLAAQRQGGEAHGSIVLRDRSLGAEPWTYQRHSQAHKQTRKDAATLGELTALGELAEVLEGLGPKDLTAAVRESSSGSLEPNVATYGRRSLADGELGRPTHMVTEALVDKAKLLRTGDLLVGIYPQATRDRPVVVQVLEDALPATLEMDLLAVRFRPEVSAQTRELVQGYLGSPHALEWLRAEGATGRVRGSHLQRLAVPTPKEEVLQALDELAETERVYSGWAEEAREARRELFARSSFAETVPKLLRQQRLERERVQAGRDSRSLDYLVRNYYPHPVAERREKLLQEPHGESRARNTQQCAEIAVSLVSFLAQAQWRALDPGSPVFPPALAQFVTGGKFNFDWGKHRTFLDAVIAATRKHDNPLSLPIPELATLDVTEPWAKAEARLRDERNKAAHLVQLTDREQRAQSERHEAELSALLDGLALLSTAQLAVVGDYSRDPLSGERRAELQILRGASRIFPRETVVVPEELARGSVGVLAHDRFHTLTPWLVWERCPQCEQEELFALARFDGESAEYLGQATGHLWSTDRLVEFWRGAIQASTDA